MPQVAMIGAGSFVFARRLVTDLLTWPSLQDSIISICRAVQLDPLTASLLSLAEIRQMVDQMFEAHAEYLGF